MPLGSKLTLPRVSQFYIDLCKENLKWHLPIEPLIEIWPNWTGMVPGWSPTNIVQMVLISCISRSQGQEIGVQNACFKNLLVWHLKAQSFHIWYITLSRGPLPKLFKLCPWGSLYYKWLHCDLWPFPQVSDPVPFRPSCFCCCCCVFTVCPKHTICHKVCDFFNLQC